jgi:hypothetical protein
MSSILLMGSCAIHSRLWFRVVANHTSIAIKPFSAHDHQLRIMLRSVTLSNSQAIGITMKLLSRNQELKRPN